MKVQYAKIGGINIDLGVFGIWVFCQCQGATGDEHLYNNAGGWAGGNQGPSQGNKFSEPKIALPVNSKMPYQVKKEKGPFFPSLAIMRSVCF